MENKLRINEEWREIDGYSGYFVSNYGNVWGKRGKQLKACLNPDGYPVISLYADGKAKPFPIHRLVAKAFIPNPNNYPFVNHIDAVKTNNYVENLEWCTHEYNIRHAYRIHSRKENWVPPEELYNLRIKFLNGATRKELVEEYGVSRAAIDKYVSGLGMKYIKYLDNEDLEELKELWGYGKMKIGELAKRFGCHRQTIRRNLKKMNIYDRSL